MIHYLKRLFFPQSPLRKWALKHNAQKCENYVQIIMLNGYQII